MTIAGRTERVLLDASPFFRFGEVGIKALTALGKYLGNHAAITLEVQRELQRNAAKYTFLANLERLGWPPPALELPPRRREELIDIRAAQVGSHVDEHLGEISTVLMAQELGGTLTIIDDDLGKRLCRYREIPRLSTARLAAEMTGANAITEEMGYAAFDNASPDGVGEREFRRAVGEVREALGV